MFFTNAQRAGLQRLGDRGHGVLFLLVRNGGECLNNGGSGVGLTRRAVPGGED